MPTTTNSKIVPFDDIKEGDEEGGDPGKPPAKASFDSPEIGTGISNLRKTLIKENTGLGEV